MNDDWFWLYFAIYSLKSKIVSNDRICDHYYKCFHSKSFMKWRDLTMITFKFSKNRFILKDCKPYSKHHQHHQQHQHQQHHTTAPQATWFCSTIKKPISPVKKISSLVNKLINLRDATPIMEERKFIENY